MIDPAYWDAVRLAKGELIATDAAFSVFEHGGQWYELAKGRKRAKRICGARRKTGERCRSKSLHRGDKCKFHGGLSSGAKTPEGKTRSVAAMLEGRWKSKSVIR